MHALIKGLTEALKHSVKLPNKKASFALNRIGMDTAVIYLFIIIALTFFLSTVNDHPYFTHSFQCLTIFQCFQ